MAHRSLNTLVFAGFEPSMASAVISIMGDKGLPEDIRITRGLNIEPWQNIRSGLMIIGMEPSTDYVRVSQLIQNRTTFWDVAVCIPRVLSYYSVALLAQGAVQVMCHPQDDLDGTKNQLCALLRNLASYQSDAFGLEVADLIQLYGEKRMAKTLRLTGNGCIGSIFLHDGKVVHAETMDEEEGMGAFRRLIALSNPEIRVHKGCLTENRTIGIPAMSALLEGSRQVDEELASNSSEFDLLDSEDPEDMSSMDGVPKLNENDVQPSSGLPPYPKPAEKEEEPPKKKVDPLKNLFSDHEFNG